MGQQPPNINDSQLLDIIREVRALAPFYTSEWAAADDKSPDNALLKLFAHMLDTSIRRLNKVPEKNFIAFLDMLGIKQVPAQPARAPLTFSLTKGAPENVLIPENSQAAAGEVTFETETNIVATPAKLTDAYSVNIDQDAIQQAQPHIIEGEKLSGFSTRLTYDAKVGDKNLFLNDVSGLEEGDILEISGDDDATINQLSEYVKISEVGDTLVSLTEQINRNHDAEQTTLSRVTVFEPFDGRNLQEHILYLGHKDLFNIKPAENSESNLKLGFTFESTSEQMPALEWSHWGKKEGAEKEEWLLVEATGDKLGSNSGDITLTIKNEVKETEVNGIKNRWLRARVKGPLLKEKSLPVINTISVGIGNILRPDAAFHNDVPLDLTIDNDKFKEDLYPFGKIPRLLDTFYLASNEAFSKKEITVYLNFDVSASGSAIPVENIHGIGPTFGKILKENNIFTVDQLLQRSETELMVLLKTRMRNRVKNILSAARKAFVEASLLGVDPGARTSSAGISASSGGGTGMSASGSLSASDTAPDNLDLSWEYWNGTGWAVISNVDDGTNKLRSNGSVSFPCPLDIEPTQVNGQESYWIRVRIAGGDYGKEIVYDSNSDKWVPNYNNISPPFFSMITVSYSLSNEYIEDCFTYNNLEYTDVTEENNISGKTFQPFLTPDDEHQTLYLGFDKKLESGPISIFLAIQEPQYIAEKPPRIVWEYFAQGDEGGEWLRLQVLDNTKTLSRNGSVEFIVPDDYIPCIRFGQELYWIRAVVADDGFRSSAQVYTQALEISKPTFIHHPALLKLLPKSFSLDYSLAKPSEFITTRDEKGRREKELEECPPSHLLAFHPLWAAPSVNPKYSPNPIIEGIYLNTTWALQMEVIKDEILGSSDGETGQTFTLTKVPVAREEIWVNEFNNLSEDEIDDILDEDELEFNEVLDDKGNRKEFWIKWMPVDELLASTGEDRVYEIDRISGSIKFGDDTNGIIPPIGTDNIKANYWIGGGKSGNVDSSKITELKTSMAFVDKVSNPIPAAGGSEKEEIESVLERGPQTIRHRNRAVTREDFEWLARQASPNIVRAKCLPNFNNKGELESGWVTVIIVPESEEKQPTPTLELKSQAEAYIKDRSANTVVSPEHLQISQPVYVEVSVETTISTTTIDAVPEIESEALSLLDKFLHPLTGGFKGEGWDFGKAPCLSDFFALLENIEGVDHVAELRITAKAGEKETLSELDISLDEPGEIEMPLYTLVCSGEHEITVNFQKEA